MKGEPGKMLDPGAPLWALVYTVGLLAVVSFGCAGIWWLVQAVAALLTRLAGG